MEIRTILWREWVFFKKRWLKVVTSQTVTPFLYLITFGYGIGNQFDIDGMPYLFFIIPGIIGMTTMRSGYSYISSRITISRLHEKSFENYLLSPMRLHMIVFGYLIAGALRSMISVVIILMVLAPFGALMTVNLSFLGVCFLNAMMFSALGLLLAMAIDTHYDLNRVQTFIITPMSFLCGTFFSLTQLPLLISSFIELLPLTHSIRLLRKIFIYNAFDGFSFLVMLFYTGFFYLLCIRICYEESRI